MQLNTPPATSLIRCYCPIIYSGNELLPPWNERSVADMNSIFNSIRGFGFRRGPQRLLGGIAGGIADRIGINVWLTRLLILLLFLLPVIGWILYIVVWILTPWQDGSIPLERLLGNTPNAR